MGIYLGWDIGGVHLKLSRLICRADGGELRTFLVPFEIWKDPGGLAARLAALLREARGGEGAGREPAAHGVTMTAELADAFPSRRDGVRAILAACCESLAGAPIRVLDAEGALLSVEAARERPAAVAAANWRASAGVAARALAGAAAVLVDVGSTTTDIIPIDDGTPCPVGRTDVERLASGELVYSGLLRTPPASFASSVPLSGRWCRIAPEHFAVTADVYRVLGRIGAEAYTVPTPDGRGKSREEAAARIARLVCSEVHELGARAVERIAAYLEDRQIDQLARALWQVLSRLPDPAEPRAIVAGTGAFLAEAAAGRAGLRSTPLQRLLPRLTGDAWAVAAPSAALALLLAEEAGESVLRPVAGA